MRMFRTLYNSGGACAPATVAKSAKHLLGLTFPSGVGGWDGGWVGLYDGWWMYMYMATRRNFRLKVHMDPDPTPEENKSGFFQPIPLPQGNIERRGLR
eukprot:6293735-Prorocentrum_lima.AAC.1